MRWRGATILVPVHLPDWLNPWWTETREINSPLSPDAARSAIMKASGFLSGSLGRVLLSRSLTVFRESWWHIRRPWAVARVTVKQVASGSVVSLRIGRTWFQAVFITGFAIFALGTPIAFFIASAVSGNLDKAPWWSYPGFLAQDGAIYVAIMALNSGFVRRDAAFLVRKVAGLVSATEADLTLVGR